MATQFDFGPQKLLKNTLVIGNSTLLNQTYSNLVITQQPLEDLNLGSGLSVKAAAYQNRMRNQARYSLQSISPGVIFQLVDTSSFANLVGALTSQVEGISSENSEQLHAMAEACDAISENAKRSQINLDALTTKLSVSVDSLTSLMLSFEKMLDEVETQSESDVSHISALIDKLNEDISNNIQGIVDGGKQAGEGVTEIGRKIISILEVQKESDKTDESSKNDKKSTDKEKKVKSSNTEKATEESNPSENVEYFVTGVSAISNGVAASSAAGKALKQNNELISKAYHDLAKVNSILSVAKTINAQNSLFVDSYTSINSCLSSMFVDWKDISENFKAASKMFTEVKSESDLKNIKTQLAEDNQRWKIISQQVNELKTAFAGFGSLPDAN